MKLLLIVLGLVFVVVNSDSLTAQPNMTDEESARRLDALAERLSQVKDDRVRALLQIQGSIGQAAGCQLAPERLAALTQVVAAMIQVTSDKSAVALGNDIMAEGAARQRAGRGQPCSSVRSAIEKSEAYFRGQGLLH